MKAKPAVRAKVPVRSGKVPATPVAKKLAAKKGAGLSPLEKARLARAANKAAGKAPAVRKPKKTYPTLPPSDFKSHGVRVTFRTGPDGGVSSEMKVEHIRGKWDPMKDTNRSDMFAYDPKTAAALMSRLSGRLFSPNPNFENKEKGTGLEARRRLLPNTIYTIILRITAVKDRNAKKERKILASRIVDIGRSEENPKTGKLRMKWFDWRGEIADRKDPDVRKLRPVGRFLAGAFSNDQLPPRKSRRKSDDEQE